MGKRLRRPRIDTGGRFTAIGFRRSNWGHQSFDKKGARGYSTDVAVVSKYWKWGLEQDTDSHHEGAHYPFLSAQSGGVALA